MESKVRANLHKFLAICDAKTDKQYGDSTGRCTEELSKIKQNKDEPLASQSCLKSQEPSPVYFAV